MDLFVVVCCLSIAALAVDRVIAPPPDLAANRQMWLGVVWLTIAALWVVIAVQWLGVV